MPTGLVQSWAVDTDRETTLACWSSSVLAGHDQAPFLSASAVTQDQAEPSLPQPQPSHRPMLPYHWKG
jgi:hypothetical protein